MKEQQRMKKKQPERLEINKESVSWDPSEERCD